MLDESTFYKNPFGCYWKVFLNTVLSQSILFYFVLSGMHSMPLRFLISKHAWFFGWYCNYSKMKSVDGWVICRLYRLLHLWGSCVKIVFNKVMGLDAVYAFLILPILLDGNILFKKPIILKYNLTECVFCLLPSRELKRSKDSSSKQTQQRQQECSKIWEVQQSLHVWRCASVSVWEREIWIKMS